MIIGCGIDVVRVERFSKLVKNDRFLKRFFHPIEVEYIASSSSRSAESLAARFAAKEAFAKALGTGLGTLTLRDICVKKEKNGRPILNVFAEVKAKLELTGANYIHLSLSHEKDYAIAQVILEK